MLAQWLPESARYLAATGRTDEALSVLRRVAKDNGKPMLVGRLIVDDLSSDGGGAGGSVTDIPLVSGEAKSPLSRLLSPELKLTSVLLWFIWSACAFCYYGMVLMSTELLASAAAAEDEGGCLNRNPGAQGSNADWEDCSAGCKHLTRTDYADLLWTTLAEFPGTLFFVCTLV